VLSKGFTLERKSVAAVRLVALTALVCCRGVCGQQPQLLDVPGLTSNATKSLPLDSESHTALEQSLKARDLKRAEVILLKKIERSPKSPELLTFLGGVFFLDRNYSSSAAAMKKAEALAPLDDRSRFTLAMAYITLNHRDWARPELEKLARADPKNARYRADQSLPSGLRRWPQASMLIQSDAKILQIRLTFAERRAIGQFRRGLFSPAIFSL